jgi:hypothetical protein
MSRNLGLCPTTEKRRYRSRARAQRMLRDLHEANARLGLLAKTRTLRGCYRCPYCNDWHLTKQARTNEKDGIQ